MRKSIWLVGCAMPLLAACDGIESQPSTLSGPYIRELPESVRAIAAPYQDLNAVRIDPVDGCYVYRHVGPVETTFLPLTTASGRPICTRAPEDAVETG